VLHLYELAADDVSVTLPGIQNVVGPEGVIEGSRIGIYGHCGRTGRSTSGSIRYCHGVSTSSRSSDRGCCRTGAP
jgi:hypothetical protein